MAITISAPRRTFAKMPAPTGRAYDDLAAKYGETFRRAQEQQEENQVSEMILRWQKGEVSYEELRIFLEDKINSAPEGSSKRINYMDYLQKAEVAYKKMFEDEQVAKVERKRAELLENYQEGGITSKEELSIVQELKKVADPDSDAFRSLIAEEAKIRTTIAESGAAAGAKGAANEAARQISEVNSAMRISWDNYQNGLATGSQLDNAILQNAQEALNIIENARKAGVNVSRADYSLFDPSLGKEIEIGSIIAGAEKRVELRSSGIMFDVVDRSGKLTPVTLPELVNDVVRNPMNPQYQRAPYIPAQDPVSGLWKLADPSTGEFLTTTDKKGKQTQPFFQTKESAEVYSKQNFPGYQLAVMTDRGLEEWTYDDVLGTFSPKADPTAKFMSIPTAPEQRQLFQYQRPEGISDEEFNKLVQRGQQTFIESGGMGAAPRLEWQAPSFGPQTEPVKGFDFKGIPQKIGEFAEKAITKPAGALEEKVFGAKPGETPFGYLGRKIQPFIEPVKQFATNLFKPSEGGGLGGGIGFGFPEINIPKFNLPSFTMSSRLSMPSDSRSQVSGAESLGPTMQPTTTGFGERIKSFGQRVVGGIKSLLNI